jgi:hypothetical protein
MTEQYEDLAGGLNNLIAEAQAMGDGHYEDRTERVRTSRQKLSAYRGELQGLFNDINYTRECEAAVARQLLGQQPAQITHDSEAAPAILPPKHKPSPDEFAKVAYDLTQGDRPPRFLQRVASR